MQRSRFLLPLGVATALVLSSLLSACGGSDPPPAASEPAPAAPDLAAALDALIPEAMTEATVPGLAVAVVRAGELVYERAFGIASLTTGEPVTGSTVFEAASLSKPVFAYRVLELAEEGRLDLDRPLAELLDEPWVDDPRLEQITARRVLAHSSGFPNWRPGRWGPSPQPLTIDFEPGSRFSYSGEGYMYLQAVVEQLTGRPLAEELASSVLEPLGMTSSSFVWRAAYEKSAAIGHEADGEPADKFRPEAALAAGSLHTTAADFANFLLAMLDPAADRNPMLTATSEVGPGLSWGLGWGLEETAAGVLFWHWGDNETFKALVFGSRDAATAVVVLTNGKTGLKACRPIVETVFPGEHPALGFRMLNY